MPEPVSALCCDLLVFDLDGTLIDSTQDLANSVNATLDYLGRTQLSPKAIADFVGDGASMLMQRALQATGVFNESLLATAMPFFFDYYRSHNLDTTHCYPGAIRALKDIREAAPSLPMAILTNKPFRPSRAICSGLGLSEFFFANYGGDSFPARKPDPQGLQVLMQEAAHLLGRPVSTRRTVLIGDSHVDVETARNAGARSIGCLYGFAPETLRSAGPDALVNHPSEWLATLRTVLA